MIFYRILVKEKFSLNFSLNILYGSIARVFYKGNKMQSNKFLNKLLNMCTEQGRQWKLSGTIYFITSPLPIIDWDNLKHTKCC